jgi:pyruvate kinase
VMPNLNAVIATLEIICDSKSDRHFQRPPIEFFFEGDRLLQQHTEELFGESSPHRRVRIMVTLDTEAATTPFPLKEYGLFLALSKLFT